MDSSNSNDLGIDVWGLLNATVDTVRTKRNSQGHLQMLLKDSTKARLLMNRTIFEADSVFRVHQDVCIRENKGLYWYLLGRLYDSSPDLRHSAIEFYEKALKLDPSMVMAWNAIGEAYWLSGKKDLAKSCFQKALLKDTTKVTLRNMSLVARHEASDSALREHKEENLKKGITYAKEAVALDPGDGNSWAILGNAYLTQFFNGETQDNTIIEKALQAYTQAERSEAANINPELHFNKGIALTFKEAFKDAINCFKKSLSVDPLFPFAKEKLNVTLKYLNRIKELIESKGKLKEKRIKNMLVDLEKGGSGIEDKTLKKVYILELTSGKNENKYLEGKVLWSTQIDDGFPFTFGLIDGKRTLAAVTMFNLAVGKGVLIGDTVAILNPLFDIMEFQLNEKVDYYIPKVRVNCPMSVVVNKKPVPTTWRSAAGITTIEAN